MALSRLPIELLDAVANALDNRRDLQAFAATSSIHHAVVQPILYRHIAVSPLNTHSLSVAYVLEASPLLARHVRSFTLVIPTSHKLDLDYYRSLSNALSHMRGLTSLKLTIDPALSWVLPDASELRFHQLRNFTCVFSLDHNVIQFLGKTSSLMHLELGHDLNALDFLPELHPSWLHKLSSFAGSSRAAQAIIPGRPVSSISMHSGDLTEEVVHILAQSTAAVSFLDATTQSLPLPLLEAMAFAIPGLQELRLATTYNLWDEWFNTPFIRNIKNALVSMNNLKTAEVSGMLWRWHNKEGRVLANEPQVPPDVPGDDETSYFHA